VTQLGGTFFYLLLEGFKGGLQAQFTVAEVDQAVAGFVLPSTTPQGGGHQTDQGHRMERTLEEGHVAQLRTDTGRRVLFRPAVMGQQDNGQVGPGWLLFDLQEQRFQVGPYQSLRRNHQQAGTAFQLFAQMAQVAADEAGKTGFIEDHQGDLAVPSQRREDQRPLGQRLGQRHRCSSLSSGLLSPM